MSRSAHAPVMVSLPLLATPVVLVSTRNPTSGGSWASEWVLGARCHLGGGDWSVSTRSPLRARAHSGGWRVLGCHLIHLVSMRLAL